MTARPLPATHDCPGGCRKPVPHHIFACRDCWIRLPSNYRRDIRATYNIDHHEHAQAMVRAMVWYRSHPRRTPVPVTSDD